MQPQEDRLEALLLDNRFVDWVLNPGSKYASYWESWAAENEAQATLAACARAIVLEIGMEEEYDGEDMSEENVDALFGKIREDRERGKSAGCARPLVSRRPHCRPVGHRRMDTSIPKYK